MEGNMINKWFLPLIFIFHSLLFSQEPNQTLLSDFFNDLKGVWNEIVINGENPGHVEIEDGNLKLTGSDGYFGIYHNKLVKGHFIVDLEFETDQNIGLALILNKEGKPDLNNYTMLCVDTEKGHVVVHVRDCQNGKHNVLDYTRKTNFNIDFDEEDKELNIGSDLYKHVLTGNQYSVPFTKTNKTVRIFREDNAGFFHYYYQVSREYKGRKYVDWMELRPSPEWTEAGSEYFVAIISLHEGETNIKAIKALKKPVKDYDDRTTGFKVTQREYNWSGFMGDAFVVTFDDAFQFSDRDIKFVFWTEMNFIPAWHLNNQLFYTYEFVETWDEEVAGCHEPMSDRLRQWSRVRVLEDNPVRKVLKWHYVLCNPNYEVPAEGKGKQLPEVDETWTIYPDGSGTRYIRYTPKLDADLRAAHELGELISIAGSKAHSSDFYASPALTMMNLEGNIKQAHPGPKFDYYSDIDDWKEQILIVHFKSEPDVFCVWSHNPEIPETYSGYPIRYENAWQNPRGKIVHWPVNKRPYTSAFSSGGTWKAEVSHACLLSWGVRDGIEWKDHYKIDKTGRKYREWVSLIGLNKQNNKQELFNKARSWLFKGEVKTSGKGIKFVKKDYKNNSFIFDTQPDSKHFTFRIIPDEQSSPIINPVIRINNWGKLPDVQISIDDQQLTENEYRISCIDDDILIWLQARLKPENKVKIERK
jgi:hypothetical protein